MTDWQPIDIEKCKDKYVFLWDCVTDQYAVGTFEDWYKPEFVDQEGQEIEMIPSHYMEIPATPKPNSKP